jgi:hypothetical protein
MSFRLDGELVDIHDIYNWAKRAGSGATVHQRAMHANVLYRIVFDMNQSGIEYADEDEIRHSLSELKKAGYRQ